MEAFPTLRTERLVLRAFTLQDAPTVQRLAGVREVAEMIYPVPYPYEDGVAEGGDHHSPPGLRGW